MVPMVLETVLILQAGQPSSACNVESLTGLHIVYHILGQIFLVKVALFYLSQND